MAADECIIFYSWESDLPNSTNRSLILKSLENVAKSLRADESITVEPVIDRDTQNIPGSPDIASTIFGKIDQAQVFVCDVSIIDQNAERPSPNPNVLLELGYALKALTHERVIMVMNTAFGKIDDLPFDLRLRRVLPYHKAEGVDDQGAARKQLEGMLAAQLRIILQGLDQLPQGELIQPRTPAQLAHEAIEANRPDTDERVRTYMEWLGQQIAALTPKRKDDDQAQWDEDLIAAIHTTAPLVLKFTQLAQFATAQRAADALTELYEGLGHVLDLYQNPSGYTGIYYVTDFDLPRFLGHELLVTFCGVLLRAKRWESLADLLSRDIYVINGDGHEPGTMHFTALSEFVRLLHMRKVRLKSNRRLLHSDLLKERHTEQGPLAQAVPMDLFMAADYFLFLRAQLAPDKAPQNVEWRPWSIIFLRATPRFLVESTQIRIAEPLARALGVDGVEQLRARFVERAGQIQRLFDDFFWDDPLRNFDPRTIGTR